MSGTRGPIFKQAFIAGAERSVGSCAGGGAGNYARGLVGAVAGVSPPGSLRVSAA